MPKMTKIFEYIFWSFIFILLFILQFSHFRLDSDNGIFLAGAWNLVNNLQIYRDFFSFTAPGSYYLILVIWKVFGISYWAAWITGFIFLCISTLLIYKITIRVNKRSAYLAVLIFVLSTIGWPIITSHIFCLPFILGAIYLTIKWTEKQRFTFICLAGFSGGVGVIFLQTIGLATILGLLVFLLLFYWKKCFLTLNKLAIFLISAAIPSMFLFLKWPPFYLFDNLVRFPLSNYSKVISLNYWLLIYNLVFLTIFFLILRKQKKYLVIVRLLYILGIFLLLTTISFPDFLHICFVSAPTLMLFSIFSIEFFRVKFKGYYYLAITVIFSFSIYFIFYFLSSLFFSGFSFLILKNQTIPVIDFINQNCKSKYIYAGPFIPEIYFESRKLSPGQTDWLLTGAEKYYELTLKGFKEKEPDCAILGYKIIEKFDYDKNNVVDNYIINNYRKSEQFGGIYVFKR